MLAKPIVFSLRDMWLFTGGCHYSGDCAGFTRDCAGCPLLAGDSDGVTVPDLAFKARWLAGADAFVAISAHVAALAQRSTVLRDADVRVIPNSIDAARFAPADKAEMRRKLGLPETGFVVGFGALHLAEARKGGPMMARIMAEWAGDAGLHWAVFGGDPPPLPGNATWLGKINDDAQLSAVYAACDLFVMPSLQETFGKMTAEALAAGTPVLAFGDTPADEIVQHGVSGWLVPLGDEAALARGISAARALPDAQRIAAGLAGRRHVLASYGADVVADLHLRLYAEKIEQRRAADR
jgi:glycosyltransferase involved in cell wall biosynthesis